jgi:ABC-type nitrate/sulfonate/bicarbonate transport system substrate-binding protein
MSEKDIRTLEEIMKNYPAPALLDDIANDLSFDCEDGLYSLPDYDKAHVVIDKVLVKAVAKVQDWATSNPEISPDQIASLVFAIRNIG